MNTDVTVLVGDVGGSNTRLALAGPEIGVTALKSFDNDSFTSLEDVLTAYRAQPDLPEFQGACIAVAGKEVEVAHSVCTGGYGGDLNQIDQLELSFIEEEDGDVVIMQYSVCEI